MTDVQKYKKILKETPTDAETHFKLGNEYKRLGYFQQAIQHYKEAIRIKPSATVQNSLGLLHLQLKHYPEAARHFSQTLRINPDNADAHNGLGEIGLSLKNYKEAIQHFSKASEVNPGAAIYHYNLGRAYQKLDYYTDAANKYKEAVRIEPFRSEAHFYLGFVYCKLELYEKAIQEFHETIKIDPDSAEAYSNMGFAFTALGNHGEAIKAYKEAIRINPNLPEVYKNLDEAYQKIGSLKDPSIKTSTPINKSKGLAQVAGMQELKQFFFDEIIRPTRDPELYSRFRLSIPNGILLCGPPGCGKTFIAKQLAEEMGWLYLEAKGASAGNISLDGVTSAARDVFLSAEKNAPSLLFIDKFETLVPNLRQLHAEQHSAREINDFLAQLKECALKRIFVIGATNDPDKIDESFQRPGRMEKMIYVGPPDMEARIESLKMYLSDRPVENIDIVKLARLLEGYPYRDIHFIVDEAARIALKGGSLFIDNEHMIEAIHRNPSSLTPTTLSKYKKFRQRKT
jgi:tetratricopeptide (TPR) repeat protein